MIPHLPVELLLTKIARLSSQKELVPLCLANWQWHDIAIRELYKSIHLCETCRPIFVEGDEDEDDEIENISAEAPTTKSLSERLRCLCWELSLDSSKANLVEEIDIKEMESKTVTGELRVEQGRQIQELVLVLPNLRELVLLRETIAEIVLTDNTRGFSDLHCMVGLQCFTGLKSLQIPGSLWQYTPWDMDVAGYHVVKAMTIISEHSAEPPTKVYFRALISLRMEVITSDSGPLMFDWGEDGPKHSVDEDVLSDHIRSIGDSSPSLRRCAIIDGCRGNEYWVRGESGWTLA
ncbi:uncharacterized protein STEHIDRAFT_115814 [Stereum hirsutum FP-91666 SS1]|uniref:Uncharacterized protein n=1 Tax=Stereum hirsutum (strain FP-91666) TaxID=721885 RepID=R7RY71_STEHR|nr:uncharacterized protein STEHIDRAFT_115814 [Stereum hirsutum FP-91666 SS1]EIM80351.1 hypothetical protein STEHIDRAFT_115814 [Stereum hirsutum FP-91666 SS1]